MKTQILFALLANAALLLNGCTKTESRPDVKTEIIADASYQIQKITGSKQDYTITEVKQLNTSKHKGFALLVSYKLQDGTAGNYAVLSGVKYNFNGQHGTVSQNARETYTCTRTGGTCPCLMLVFYEADEDIYYLFCSCNSDCKIKVTNN